MRVALADDSTLFRAGLERLLAELGVEVIATVATGDELLDCVERDPPDVAILDIRMPPTFTDEGLEAALRVRSSHPSVAVLLLSTYAETSSAARLLAGGADGAGYLLKDRVDDPRALRDVLYRLVKGECVVDPDLVAALVGARRTNSDLDRLTEREGLVLRHMAEGHSNAGISSALFLSAKTVETHVSSIFTKLALPPETSQNRRVLAVLTWLRVHAERT